jgi:hypothetical protein
MDLSRYKELKEKGSIKLQRLGPNFFQIVSRQFDSHNGKELTPEVVNCNAQGVVEATKQADTALKKHQDAVESLNMLKVDMETAEAKNESV